MPDPEFDDNVRSNVILYDKDGNAVAVPFDGIDEIYRLAITGKVSISRPDLPPAATEVSIDASSPLSVTGTETTNHAIASGKTFHMQQVTAGAEGDPSDAGSKVEIFYVDSGSTEHIIERVYIVGFSQFAIYPDTTQARDGTSLDGTGTELIRVKRIRFGGNAQEIDAVVRGFEK